MKHKNTINKFFIFISFLFILNPAIHAQVFNDQVFKLRKIMGLISTFYVDSVNQP